VAGLRQDDPLAPPQKAQHARRQAGVDVELVTVAGSMVPGHSHRNPQGATDEDHRIDRAKIGDEAIGPVAVDETTQKDEVTRAGGPPRRLGVDGRVRVVILILRSPAVDEKHHLMAARGQTAAERPEMIGHRGIAPTDADEITVT